MRNVTYHGFKNLMKLPFKPILLIVVSCWLPNAWAIDCTKASTEFELTICGDAGLMEADKNLGRAYAGARKGLSPKEIVALRIDQRKWIKSRDMQCKARDSGLHGLERTKFVANCLQSMLINRTRVLAFGFDIKEFPNTNALVWDKSFSRHTKAFFKNQKGTLLWSNGLLWEQVVAAMGGPPDDIIQVMPTVFLATACRQHYCPEKGAYIVSGQLELYGVIGYQKAEEHSDIFDDGFMTVFYHDDASKSELLKHLVEWQEREVPKAGSELVLHKL